jgi:hypothetical protein
VLVAVLAGSLSSIALFLLFYSTDSIASFWPQAIGFYACIMTRRVQRNTKSDFLAIMVPTNAGLCRHHFCRVAHFRSQTNPRVDASAAAEVRQSVAVATAMAHSSARYEIALLRASASHGCGVNSQTMTPRKETVLVRLGIGG